MSDNIKNVISKIQNLTKSSLQLGIFNHQRADILRKHELGIDVPRREILKNTLNKYRKDIIKNIQNIINKTNLYKEEGMDKVLKKFGEYYTNHSIKEFINKDGKDLLPPLSPSTIQMKLKKGSLHPETALRDTDEMYNNLSYRVVKK